MSSRRAVLVGRRHTSTTTGIFSRPLPTWGAGESPARSMSIAVRVARRTKCRDPRSQTVRNVARARNCAGQSIRAVRNRALAGRGGGPPGGAPAITRDATTPHAHVDHTDALSHPGEVSIAPARSFPYVAARRLSPEPGTLPSTSAWCVLSPSPVSTPSLDVTRPNPRSPLALSKQIRRRRANPTRQHPHTRATLTASRARGFWTSGSRDSDRPQRPARHPPVSRDPHPTDPTDPTDPFDPNARNLPSPSVHRDDPHPDPLDRDRAEPKTGWTVSSVPARCLRDARAPRRRTPRRTSAHRDG